MTLRERLVDWVDWDVAMFSMAVVLGIVPDGSESWFANKGLFWSSNPREEYLAQMLQDLVHMRILEYRNDPDQQYRWKS